MPLISVVGAGHVGLALVADLTCSGAVDVTDINLVACSREGRDRIPRHVTVHHRLSESHVTRADFGQVRAITLDELHPGELGGHMVFVTVPDIPWLRPEVLRRVIGALEGSETVVLVRGGQGGAVVLAEYLSTAAQDLTMVLIEDSFYGCRYFDGQLDLKRKFHVNAAAYERTPDAFSQVCQLFDRPDGRRTVLERKTPLELLFYPLGYIVHAAVALWPPNFMRTSRGEQYLHYTEGIDRELAERLALLDAERVALAQAYGVTAEPYSGILERQYGLKVADLSFYDMMQACRGIYRSKSAGSLAELRRSRQLHEDVPALYTIANLARVAGMSLPATEQLLRDVKEMLVQGLGVDVGTLQGYHDRQRAMSLSKEQLVSMVGAG